MIKWALGPLHNTALRVRYRPAVEGRCGTRAAAWAGVPGYSTGQRG